MFIKRLKKLKERGARITIIGALAQKTIKQDLGKWLKDEVCCIKDIEKDNKKGINSGIEEKKENELEEVQVEDQNQQQDDEE